MKIGIIGAGNIGGVLAKRFTELGHEVEIANSRGPDTLGEIAKRTGATPVEVTDAPRDKEVVVVTIPMVNVPDLPDGLFDDAPEGQVVVDTCNYYPRQRDGAIDALEQGTLESVWVSEQIGRPVIKAFNNIYFSSLDAGGKPAGAEDRIALPVSGDDEGQKGVVIGLIDDLGFDAVDVGSLEDSWRQQPGTPVYTADGDAAEVREALDAASRERPEEFTATSDSPGSFNSPA
ncbi:NAD(P)-binding domain-containing protein [Thermoleophilia bacterium SCSIO 60948]|nr:NAD(P)-binding domain-containing protein [Thermoleophilia bacterium SCSIO 60948]